MALESGELEIRKAFEEVTTRNVKAAVAYANETRKLFRDLENKVNDQNKLIREQNNTIELLKKQIATLQQTVFRGGTN